MRGRIQSRRAEGIEAKLRALPRDTRADTLPIVSTAGNGLFELKLPARTRSFDIIVQSPGFSVAAGRVTIEDGKYLTITLDQNGGELRLAIPRGGDLMIRHDGAEYPARWLAGLCGAQWEQSGDSETATLPDMEPGEYALCAIDGCRNGLLSPGGMLRLSVRD